MNLLKPLRKIVKGFISTCELIVAPFGAVIFTFFTLIATVAVILTQNKKQRKKNHD